MKSCIVLEGGGLRGAFTSGVLEYLLEREIGFDRVIGVSAGACIGASFVSKQCGRNKKVNVEYPSDPRYMGFRHLLRTGSYFNMEFVFGELPGKLVPFDETTFYKNLTEFDVVTTSLQTGASVVFTKGEIEKIGLDKVLVASSSIPLLSRPVPIGKESYLDGGVADSIPVKYALNEIEKAVVVLTRPRGYRKEKFSHPFLFKMAFRKHPEFLMTLLHRNEVYNKTLDYCDQMEREGQLFIIAPSPEFSVGRTEKRLSKRIALYNHGYQIMSQKFEAMQQFLPD